MTRTYLKFKDYLIEKLRNSEEAQAFLDAAIIEYENDGDIEALMLSLRYIAEAQGGINYLSEKTNLNKQNLYKVLTGKTTPRFDTMVSIIKGLGYHLVPQNVENIPNDHQHAS